jgi:hypothetical protein
MPDRNYHMRLAKVYQAMAKLAQDPNMRDRWTRQANEHTRLAEALKPPPSDNKKPDP